MRCCLLSLSRVLTITSLVVLVMPGAALAQERAVAQQCTLTQRPRRLPAANELVDSISVLTALRPMLSDGPEGLILTLIYLGDATAPAIHVTSPSAMAPDSVNFILDALLLYTRQVRFAEPNWAVRLRVRRDAERSMAVERALYCAPTPAGGDKRIWLGSRPLAGSGDAVLMPGSTRPVRVDAEISIDTKGNVANVEMRRGSGSTEVDNQVALMMRERRYHPARVDGVPIPSWIRTSGGFLKL